MPEFVGFIPSYLQNVIFDLRKKMTKFPKLGGGVSGLFGQCFDGKQFSSQTVLKCDDVYFTDSIHWV